MGRDQRTGGVDFGRAAFSGSFTRPRGYLLHRPIQVTRHCDVHLAKLRRLRNVGVVRFLSVPGLNPDSLLDRLRAHELLEGAAGVLKRLLGVVGKRISQGVLRPGDRIPSVRKACQQYRVNAGTILQAYGQLEARIPFQSGL